MVNKHAGLIILCVLSLQSTLSDDSTSPKKSFLIMKALFEVESNSKGNINMAFFVYARFEYPEFETFEWKYRIGN